MPIVDIKKRRAYQAKWRAANVNYAQTHHLKSRYGLTRADVDRMRLAQGGRCPVCHKKARRSDDLSQPKRGQADLVIDHDHSTGAIRALLCQSCNRGMGDFHDNSATLRAAADYLDKYEVIND